MSGFEDSIKLIRHRLEQLPAVLETQFELNPTFCLSPFPKNFVVTGVGASEGSARFFTYLINHYTDSQATYLPLSFFATPIPIAMQSSALVVFTQGLSANSQIALRQREFFSQTLLFTSSTTEGLIRANRTEDSAYLKDLITDGISIVHYPLEGEDGMLVRLIGPIAANLASIQFIQHQAPNSLQSPDQSHTLTAVKTAHEKITPALIAELSEPMRSGAVFLAPYPLSTFIDNLALKTSEMLFVPKPIVLDTLDLPHGNFQPLYESPRPVIYFNTPSPRNQALFEKALPLFDVTRVPLWLIESTMENPYAIIELETIYTQFLLGLLPHYKSDLINWPGKNLDSSLYEMKKPLF